MQEKQLRILVVLAAVLLALVALIVLVDPPAATPEDGEPTYQRLFPDMDAAAIETISIEAPAGTTTLQRTEAGWQLTSPVSAPADARRVDRLAEDLAGLEAGEDLLGADARDPEPFGLGSAALRVRFTGADGAAHTLEVGHDAPVGGHTYLVADGEDAVRSSRNRLSTAIAASSDDYRTKDVVRFTRSQVDEVRIDGPTGSVLLARDDHGWWVTAGGGLADRADPDGVDQLLDTLSELKVKRFLQAAEGPPTMASTTVRLREDEVSQSLVFGPAVDGEQAAIVPLQDVPVALPDVLADSLVSPPERWLSDELTVIRPITLSALKVDLDGRSFTGTRTDSGWEPAATEDLLAVLRGLRVDRRSEVPAPEGAATGAVVLTEGEGRVEQVTLHQAVEGGLVAVDSAGGAPFLVPASALATLSAALP